MLVAPFTALFIRFFFRSSLFPSKMSSFIHVLTFIPLFVLYTHLNSIGSPRRDPTTGALIGSGEDLNMSGVTEWCWDIIYVTWACQVGSAALGEWFWWSYLCVSFLIYWNRSIRANGRLEFLDTPLCAVEDLLRVPEAIFLLKVIRRTAG